MHGIADLHYIDTHTFKHNRTQKLKPHYREGDFVANCGKKKTAPHENGGCSIEKAGSVKEKANDGTQHTRTYTAKAHCSLRHESFAPAANKKCCKRKCQGMLKRLAQTSDNKARCKCNQ